MYIAVFGKLVCGFVYSVFGKLVCVYVYNGIWYIGLLLCI